MTTNFGETVKQLRKQHNITQAQLAQALSVGRPTIAGYETKGKQPDYDKLIRLAQFFNVSVDYLLNNNQNTYAFKERIHRDSTFESKSPYREQIEMTQKDEDIYYTLKSMIKKLEEVPISIQYNGHPLNKTSAITIKNTIKNLIETIEEMNKI